MGDAYGNHHGNNARKRAATFWEYSDDTIMAASIVKILGTFGEVNQDKLAAEFAERWDGKRGYGRGATQLIKQFQAGEDWHTASGSMFEGHGSFGNGAAMRVTPIGSFFADDLDVVIEQAKRSAEVTHMHPEGIAGAIAVALGSAITYRNQILDQNPVDFLEEIITFVPDSEIRTKLKIAADLPPTTSVRDAAKLLGNGRPAIAQQTVPFALWITAHHLNDFEKAITNTASVKGDVDTNCAIVGGIVIMTTGIEGIPADWLERREALPEWLNQNEK